jgi:hypothetical protein
VGAAGRPGVVASHGAGYEYFGIHALHTMPDARILEKACRDLHDASSNGSIRL